MVDTELWFYIMKLDLIVSSSKVQKTISICTCINLMLFNAGLLKFRQRNVQEERYGDGDYNEI